MRWFRMMGHVAAMIVMTVWVRGWNTTMGDRLGGAERLFLHFDGSNDDVDDGGDDGNTTTHEDPSFFIVRKSLGLWPDSKQIGLPIIMGNSGPT